MHRPNPALGLALVVLGALLFVQNAGVSRVALRAGVDPTALTSLRVTGTFAVLLVVALLFRRDALRPPRGRLGLLLVVHGLVGVAALQWTYFVALDRLPVGMALLLEYQAPILVALWAKLVQGEQVRGRLWIGLALAWGGLAAATGIWKGLTFDGVGIAAGLGAALCFAAYFLIGEHGVALLDPLRVILWSFLCATVALNLVHPVTGTSWEVVGARASLLGRLEGYSVPVWLVLGVDRRGRHPAAVRADPPRPAAPVGDHRDHGRDARADRGERPGMGVVRRDAGRGGPDRRCRRGHGHRAGPERSPRPGAGRAPAPGLTLPRPGRPVRPFGRGADRSPCRTMDPSATRGGPWCRRRRRVGTARVRAGPDGSHPRGDQGGDLERARTGVRARVVRRHAP